MVAKTCQLAQMPVRQPDLSKGLQLAEAGASGPENCFTLRIHVCWARAGIERKQRDLARAQLMATRFRRVLLVDADPGMQEAACSDLLQRGEDALRAEIEGVVVCKGKRI
nr:hypothetical protein [Mesorhizobium loti]